MDIGETIKPIGTERFQIHGVIINADDEGPYSKVLWDGRNSRLWSYSSESRALLFYEIESGVMREILGDDYKVFQRKKNNLAYSGPPDGSFALAEKIRSYRGKAIRGFEIDGMGWGRLCTEIRHATEARVTVKSLSPTKFIPFSQLFFYEDHIELISSNARFMIAYRKVRYRGSSRSRACLIFRE